MQPGYLVWLKYGLQHIVRNRTIPCKTLSSTDITGDVTGAVLGSPRCGGRKLSLGGVGERAEKAARPDGLGAADAETMNRETLGGYESSSTFAVRAREQYETTRPKAATTAADIERGIPA
jgi:hypothetical protein